jgi:acyl-coenzyme A thioesterase PaaI-like protein
MDYHIWHPNIGLLSLNINFLKKPAPAALEAQCRLLKIGKRLAVGEVSIRSEGDGDLVAHATLTYSIPPRT